MPLDESLDLTFLPDELPGYEALKFALPKEDDGALWATLVRKVSSPTSTPDLRPAVLYVHGYCDYFFQTHLCDEIEAAGYRFYALELRRYGRSLAHGNRPNQARDVTDYFTEIEWALRYLLGEHKQLGAMVAHSTGGLILCHFLKQSPLASYVPCLVLNSPFLKFNLPAKERLLASLAAQSAKWAPYVKLPHKLNGAYGKTLHVSELGEWDYNLLYKPIYGFPLYPAWFRMIRRAHAALSGGLGLSLPILSMRSSHSRFPANPPERADFYADTVLNVNHMRDLSPLLGSRVTSCVIENGVHDLYLSNELSRAVALSETVHFLRDHGKG